MINVGFRKLGIRDTVILADQLMYTGFKFATKAGMSVSVHDMLVPAEKVELIDEADQRFKRLRINTHQVCNSRREI